MTPEALVGLVGVVLGFGLSVGYQEIKELIERGRLKKALRQELRANLHSIPQKRDTIQRMIQVLERGELLPGPATRFSSTMYVTHGLRVAAYMTAKERNSYHLLYEYFRVVDSYLDGYADSIVEVLDTDEVERRADAAKRRLGDLLDLLDLSEALIQEHLAGEPRDVFYIEEDFSSVRNSAFTRK